MKLSVANKMGLSSLVMALLILAAGLAGLNGVSSLSKSLNFIMNEAWSTADGAMEGTIGLQAELIATEEMLAGVISVAQGERDINEAVEGSTEALARMVAAGLIPQNQVDEMNVKIKSFRDARITVLNAFKNMNKAELTEHNAELLQLEKRLDQTTRDLLGFLEALEENGDSKVEGELSNIQAAQSMAYTAVIVVCVIGLILPD